MSEMIQRTLIVCGFLFAVVLLLSAVKCGLDDRDRKQRFIETCVSAGSDPLTCARAHRCLEAQSNVSELCGLEP